jgi:glutamyl/glutaminyl-tRNA synthetase
MKVSKEYFIEMEVNCVYTNILLGPNIGGSFGPYTQSNRSSIYQEYIKILLEKDHAYRFEKCSTLISFNLIEF